MDNSYFILSEKLNSISIERLHLCSWEFDNNTSLIEFGFEVKLTENQHVEDSISLQLVIPWLNESNKKVTDLYFKLKDSENSKFIFNDSIKNTESLDGGKNQKGVIQTFFTRTPLCLLPFEVMQDCKKKCLTIKLDLSLYLKIQHDIKPNIYFRFYLEPGIDLLSTRKSGISKSTIIYDIKINDRRSAPDELTFNKFYEFPKIKNCFCLQIVPTNFDMTFYESALKNIRILEYDAFNKYIGDNRVKKDKLLVIFNKKVDSESYSFFSIFKKERIGTGQFALAILINLFCGLLLYLTSKNNSRNTILFAFIFIVITLNYFIYPKIRQFVYNLMKKK